VRTVENLVAVNQAWARVMTAAPPDLRVPTSSLIAQDAALTPELLLAHLRAARVRAKLCIAEIDSIGIALKAGVIGIDDALAWLSDVDAMRFLLLPESEAA
jgi:hypothetical protein